MHGLLQGRAIQSAAMLCGLSNQSNRTRLMVSASVSHTAIVLGLELYFTSFSLSIITVVRIEQKLLLCIATTAGIHYSRQQDSWGRQSMKDYMLVVMLRQTTLAHWQNCCRRWCC